MPLPEAFLEHLRNEGYHPRSDKHSNVLAECIVSDLLDICAPLAEQAQKGEVVYTLNFDVPSLQQFGLERRPRPR